MIKSGLSIRDFSGSAKGVLSNSVGTIVFSPSFEIIRSESLGTSASGSFNEIFEPVPVFSMLIQSFFFAWAIAALKSNPCKLLRISSNVFGPSLTRFASLRSGKPFFRAS